MKSEITARSHRESSIANRKSISALLIVLLLLCISCGRRKLKPDEIKQNRLFAAIIQRESNRALGEDGFFKDNLQSNPYPEVRRACALSLGRIGDRRALPWLYEALHPSDVAVREASAFAIGLIENRERLEEQGQPIDSRTIPELLRLLDDASLPVQMRAIEALGRTGTPAEVDRLTERLKYHSNKKSLEELTYFNFLTVALSRLKYPAGNVRLFSSSKDAAENPNPSTEPYTEAVCVALASNRYFPATAIIETTRGNIEIELFRKDAPITTAKFLLLASRGAFEGLRFARTIPFSLIESEGPRTRTELDRNTGCEINMHTFEKGSVGMAVTARDVQTNKLFITLAPQPDMDGVETCFGRVISGMNAAEKIGPGDYIKKVQIREYIGFLHILRY